MAWRWTTGLACLGAVALTPASAQQQQADPLAPLPEQQAPPPPVATPAPAAEPLRPVQTIQAPLSGFALYRVQLGNRARTAGVREATIQAVVPYLTLNRRVIELDRAQPGGPPNSNVIPPFAPYRARHVSADLIARGSARYRASQPQLQWLERRFGVETPVLLAIFGHETSYGRITGGFDLLEALATMAYEGRRRSFFEDEFIAAMRLLDRGTPRSRLRGSWAGATGYPQFMPSNVLRLATDGDGDGVANIWSSEMDALASIAAYLRDAGWKPGVHWGIPVRVPPTLNRAAIRTTFVAPRCPAVFRRHSRWLTVREWRAWGVQPLRGSLPDGEMATLIEPDGPNATAYLVTNNYRSILDYNCSNFYALAVGLLADEIVAR